MKRPHLTFLIPALISLTMASREPSSQALQITDITIPRDPEPLPPNQLCPLPTSVTHIITTAPGTRSLMHHDSRDHTNSSTIHLHTLADTYAALTCPANHAQLESLSLTIRSIGCTGFPDRWDFPFPGADWEPVNILGTRFEGALGESRTRKLEDWLQQKVGIVTRLGPAAHGSVSANRRMEREEGRVPHFPALKELVLDGYRFDSSPAAAKRRSLRTDRAVFDLPFFQRWYEWFSRSIAGEKMVEALKYYLNMDERYAITADEEVTNLERWLKVMDWSKLEVLKVNGATRHFIEKVPGKLDNLRQLELEMISGYSNGMAQVVRDAVLVLPDSARLQKLKLVNQWDPNNLEVMLRATGEEVEDLTLMYRDVYSGPGGMLLPGHVDAMTVLAPKVRRLAVQVDQGGEVQDAQIRALAKMSKLEHVKLLYQLPDSTRWQQPMLDADEYPWDELDDHLYGLPGWSNGVSTDGLTDGTKEVQVLKTFRELRAMKVGTELLSLSVDTLSTWSGRSRMVYDGETGDRPPVVRCSVLDRDGKRKVKGVPWCEG